MKKKVILSLSVIFSITLLWSSPIFALSGSDFKADRITDDGVFYNGNSMTVSQIQNFLNSKVPTCDTNGEKMYNSTQTRAQWAKANNKPLPPYTCLKGFKQDHGLKSDSGICATIPERTNRTAAQIIDEVARACNISQKALIVLLQKEQSLVTDDWPWPVQYEKATGYYCPDDPSRPGWCHPDYAGFFNQVYNAARQFNRYKLYPKEFNFAVNRTSYVSYQANMSSCGGTDLTMQTAATAGLYNYTPYQPNAAALNNLYGSGDSCSAYGNRNFWRMHNDWFGSTVIHASVFKGDASSAVYVYVDGYKVAVGSMALLQDYGHAPSSIVTLKQSTVDAIPFPPDTSGVSNRLGYLVKSPSDQDEDGGAVYLISIGRKNAIQSMDQFYRYGFDTSNIKRLPLTYINSIKGTAKLTDFIQLPNSQIFYITGANKRAIFDYETYKQTNTEGTYTPVSTTTASLVQSGLPLSNREILIKKKDSSAVYLFVDEKYHTVPSMAVYGCWGLNSTPKTPLFTLNSNDNIAPIVTSGTLGCSVQDSNLVTYILNGGVKYVVPSSYGDFAAQSIDQSLLNVVSKIPNTSNLKQAVKSNNSSTVWWIEDGKKKPVPSMSNYKLLDIGTSGYDTLNYSQLNSIPAGEIKLASGQVVKSNASASVYVIDGNARIPFANSDDYHGHGFNWSMLETYKSNTLDTYYTAAPGAINKYLYRRANDGIYLMDRNGCYTIDGTQLPNYGKTKDDVALAQKYENNIFPYISFSDCKNSSVYVKHPNEGTVYWLNEGSKHPVSSWSTLKSHSNEENPYIIKLSKSTLNTFPAGSELR